MSGICNVTAIAELLFFLFDAPVTRSAQGLEVTIPKRPFVALMRHDMIGVSGMHSRMPWIDGPTIDTYNR
jgi:hypothetical protein